MLSSVARGSRTHCIALFLHGAAQEFRAVNARFRSSTVNPPHEFFITPAPDQLAFVSASAHLSFR
jgi:hypothetical protein